MRAGAQFAACSGWLSAICVLALTGCAPGPIAGPDVYELGNIDSFHIYPKSSASQLAKTFEMACLDGPRDFASTEALLRKSGFVPRPQRGEIVTFVSDDLRPAVLVSMRGSSCAVAAASRTGQSERLSALVAQRFPEAVPLDPKRMGRDLERVWQIDGGIVFLLRSGSPYDHSRLMFGIWRSI